MKNQKYKLLVADDFLLCFQKVIHTHGFTISWLLYKASPSLRQWLSRWEILHQIKKLRLKVQTWHTDRWSSGCDNPRFLITARGYDVQTFVRNGRNLQDKPKNQVDGREVEPCGMIRRMALVESQDDLKDLGEKNIQESGSNCFWSKRACISVSHKFCPHTCL